jgi:hypothetical protein
VYGDFNSLEIMARTAAATRLPIFTRVHGENPLQKDLDINSWQTPKVVIDSASDRCKPCLRFEQVGKAREAKTEVPFAGTMVDRLCSVCKGAECCRRWPHEAVKLSPSKKAELSAPLHTTPGK